MSAAYRLTIPKASPSQNEFAFSHWRKAHASKKLWALLIRASEGFVVVPKATAKRRLTIERHGRKALDVPNLIGGAKGIIDDLVQLGLLVDDDPRHLDVVALNAPLAKGEKPHTVLILEDLEQVRPEDDPTRSEEDRRAWREARPMKRGA